MATKTRTKTYEFRRHDGNGNILETLLLKFHSMTDAETYGWEFGYDEMIVKSNYHQKA